MFFLFEDIVSALLLALILDGLFGDPRWLYRLLPHPIVLMGKAIARLEQRAFGSVASATMLFRRGRLMMIGLVSISALIGVALQYWCLRFAYGWVPLGVVMSTLIAQKSLADHVAAVGDALVLGLAEGQAAVRHIVGRNAKALDHHGVARAAVESLAENFSDGVVAPVFWGALLGLPGMLAYKMINTADSMIGYKTERYQDFGRFAAKLDDVVNWLPARLSGFHILVAASLMPGALFDRSWQAIARDAGRHRSPNAGWPEAAMAGALDFRIAGPRHDQGLVTDDNWMGDGTPDLTPDDIKTALRLFWWASGLVILVIAICLLPAL
jgi:adenosylcobinamide-phosphate synthase